MITCLGRSMGVCRKALLTAAVLSLSLLALGAATAGAAPMGEWAVFAECPTGNVELAGCIVARTESGEITIGNQTVPITNTLTLQGGFTENEAGEQGFVAAANGNTLTKAPEKVPGGLAGLVSCPEIKNIIERAACELVFENGLTGVNATTELAAPASSIGLNEESVLTESGVALSLPVKVKLENPLLGSDCHIGSNSEPMVFKLTDGTTSPPEPNKPIKGKLGTLTTRAEARILVDSGNTLVDNSFAAPGVTGCGGLFASVLDPIIDLKLGLPSASGHNTAILNNTLEQTGIAGARESE
jgi:hypothetical protein